MRNCLHSIIHTAFGEGVSAVSSLPLSQTNLLSSSSDCLIWAEGSCWRCDAGNKKRKEKKGDRSRNIHANTFDGADEPLSISILMCLLSQKKGNAVRVHWTLDRSDWRGRCGALSVRGVVPLSRLCESVWHKEEDSEELFAEMFIFL